MQIWNKETAELESDSESDAEPNSEPKSDTELMRKLEFHSDSG